jgi:sulfate transport system ATP-binding protein
MNEKVSHLLMHESLFVENFHITVHAFQMHAHLTVQANSRVALIGPNGSGKSTFLRVLAGIQPFTHHQGSILLNKKSILSIPVAKRNFGYIPAQPIFYPNLTISENLAIGLKIRKVHPHAIQAEIHAILDLLNLTTSKNDPVETLSEGQKQAVHLFRGVIIKPQLVLMDEPFNALDITCKKNVFQFLVAFQQKYPLPILFSSHSETEINEFATHVAIIEKINSSIYIRKEKNDDPNCI